MVDVEGSSVSVETRRSRARVVCRFLIAVGSLRVSSRPGARRATRLSARSLGTGRDPRASPPPIPASGNGKPREAVSRAVSTARSPREHGAAATGSVRAPLETERAGFRSDVPSVTTSRRVFEVASGCCRGRGTGLSHKRFEIFRLLAPVSFESRFCETTSAVTPTHRQPLRACTKRHISAGACRLAATSFDETAPPTDSPPRCPAGPSTWPRLSRAMT